MQHVEIPVPVPAKDQVLVKVEAAGVNPVDWKVIQAGLFKLFLPAKMPHIPGTCHGLLHSFTYVKLKCRMKDTWHVRATLKICFSHSNATYVEGLLGAFCNYYWFDAYVLTIYLAGTDIAGEVVALGPGVTSFAIGDKVSSWTDTRVCKQKWMLF